MPDVAVPGDYEARAVSKRVCRVSINPDPPPRCRGIRVDTLRCSPIVYIIAIWVVVVASVCRVNMFFKIM